MYRVLDHLKKSNKTKLSIKKLDKIMQNLGHGQFNFEVFKTAYDNDPKLQDLVSNFDQETIELKADDDRDLAAQQPDSKGKVSQMAQQATDLGP